MSDSDQNGNSKQWPLHGSLTDVTGKTCPAPSKVANFFKQSGTYLGSPVPDYTSSNNNNWFLFANGTTVGNGHDIIASLYGTSYYEFMMNLGSPTYQTYTQAEISNCNDVFGIPEDNMSGYKFDNVYKGTISHKNDPWDHITSDLNAGAVPTPGPGVAYVNPGFGISSGTAFNPRGIIDSDGDGLVDQRDLNYPRNSFRTKPYADVDMRVEKKVPFGRHTASVLVEVFNLFNRDNVLNVNAVAGPTFGTPLAYLPGREVQFGIRYFFGE